MDKKDGYYFGTEINEKWWKRYKKDNFFARGNGEYWFEDNGLYFLKYLTKDPMFVPFESIVEIKTGKWHSGNWGANNTIIKIIWDNNGEILSSGFIFSKNKAEIEDIKNFLERMII